MTRGGFIESFSLKSSEFKFWLVGGGGRCKHEWEQKKKKKREENWKVDFISVVLVTDKMLQRFGLKMLWLSCPPKANYQGKLYDC